MVTGHIRPMRQYVYKLIKVINAKRGSGQEVNSPISVDVTGKSVILKIATRAGKFT